MKNANKALKIVPGTSKLSIFYYYYFYYNIIAKFPYIFSLAIISESSSKNTVTQMLDQWF